MTNKYKYTIADFPAVQRDLYLSRVYRKYPEAKISTQGVEFEDMAVSFESDEAISSCSVEVIEGISLPSFTKRLESLLDCAAKTTGIEWVLKYSARISQYNNDPQKAVQLLCDRIASIDPDTGEVVGVMKIKRRSVKAGHAKIRIVPAEDSLQAVIRHTTAQGLKALWKSIVWRLKPQYESKTQEEENIPCNTPYIIKPCIKIAPKFKHEGVKSIELLSKLGYEVNIDDVIDFHIPLNKTNIKKVNEYNHITSSAAKFYFSVTFYKKLPPGMPENIKIIGDNSSITIYESEIKYPEFHKKAQAVSEWLGLEWKLPEPHQVCSI